MTNPSQFGNRVEESHLEIDMPKIKTKRSAAKRFKIKASGKIRCNHAYARHNMSSQTRKAKNKLKKAAYVHPADVGLVLRCLPNG